jgi:hypothetical protein
MLLQLQNKNSLAANVDKDWKGQILIQETLNMELSNR